MLTKEEFVDKYITIDDTLIADLKAIHDISSDDIYEHIQPMLDIEYQAYLDQQTD